MSLRFRRSMKIAPGLRLNFSKGSIGVSAGVRGARVSVNTKGQVYSSVGIPGTGIYNVERTNLRAGSQRAKRVQPQSHSFSSTPLIATPGLFASGDERAIAKALRTAKSSAFAELSQSRPNIAHIASAFELMYLATEKPDDIDALYTLSEVAWRNHEKLAQEKIFLKYAPTLVTSIQVTRGVSQEIRFGIDALGMLRIEILQLKGKYQEALDVAHSITPNQISALSVCECEVLLKKWDEVIATTEDIENEDEATAMLLIYRGIAFREKGLYEAAIESFKSARSSKKRHEDVLNKALFERALTYKAQGKKAAARKDLEKIFATDSDFPGVAEELKK